MTTPSQDLQPRDQVLPSGALEPHARHVERLSTTHVRLLMSNPYLPSSPASSSTSALASSSKPITRSRTLFYLSIRDSSITGYSRRGPRRSNAGYGDTVDVAEDEQDGLIGGRDGSFGVGVKGLPPKWSVLLLLALSTLPYA